MHTRPGAEKALATGSGAPSGADAVVASVSGLTAGYQKNVDVLRGLTFEARAGGVVSVLGPAGSGKSTLIDVLRLALPPTAGSAEILGADVARLSLTARAKLKRRIGVLSQQPVLVDHMTAFENVALPLRLTGAKLSRYAGDVEELLSFVGLADGDDRPVGVLSGSERRRVAAARAVVAQPKLLLADEPTAGLGPELAGRVMRLLVSMRRAGAAVIVATQDENLAASLAGPHWRMADGRIALAAAGEKPA